MAVRLRTLPARALHGGIPTAPPRSTHSVTVVAPAPAPARAWDRTTAPAGA